MEANGKLITEQDLNQLPEDNIHVLWQDDDGPTSVIDSQERAWMIGLYNGNLVKRRTR